MRLAESWQAFAAETVFACLEPPAVAGSHFAMTLAVAVHLLRFAHQAAGTGVLWAFAFVMHVLSPMQAGAPLWRPRVIGGVSKAEFMVKLIARQPRFCYGNSEAAAWKAAHAAIRTGAEHAPQRPALSARIGKP